MKKGKRVRRSALIGCLVIAAHGVLLVENASAHPGWGLIIDSDGQIYFGDVSSNIVWKLDRQHRLEPLVQGKHSHSLFLDQAGNLYGEHVSYDAANARWISSIWRREPEGTVVDIIPPTSGPPKGSGFFMDRDGNVYSVYGGASESARTELLRKTPSGDVTLVAGGERGHVDAKGPDARFHAVLGMAWAPDGSLYVVDRACVRRVTMSGEVSTVGGDPLGGVPRSEHPRLLGISVDSKSNVYVADYDYRCIRRILPDQSVETPLSEGIFWSPSGVAAAGDDLYVLEHLPESVVGVFEAIGVGPYARVRKVSADGSAATIATLWGNNTAVGVLGVGFILAGPLIVWRLRRRLARRRARSEPGDPK